MTFLNGRGDNGGKLFFLIFGCFFQKSGLRFDQIINQSLHLQRSRGAVFAAAGKICLTALFNQFGQVFLQFGKRTGYHFVVFQPFLFRTFDSLRQGLGDDVGKRFVCHKFHRTVKIDNAAFSRSYGRHGRARALQLPDNFRIGLCQTAGQNTGKIIAVDNAAFTAAGRLRFVFGQSFLQNVCVFLVAVVGRGFQPLAFLLEVFHIFLQRGSARQALEYVFYFRRQFQQHFIKCFAPLVAENVQLAENI